MKKTKYLLIGVTSFILLIGKVNGASVDLTASASSVTTGSSVTITATVSSESPVVSIEGTLMCKGSGVSSGVDMNFDDSSNSVHSKSYSVTVRPTSAGSISCQVTGARLTNMSSDSWISLPGKAVTITVKAPAVVTPKTYSSNNNLKSLGVEGYTITPAFSKDKLEYTLEVPNDTKKVNIIFQKEDDKASVSGVGERELSEGLNKIEVKVTAENGNIKTYVINITVKELDPINVKIGSEQYTIIRKEGILEKPENYEKSTIKISNEDVLCYKNEVTKTILIGLKDKKGNSSYYIYDENKHTYTKYNNIKIGTLSLSVIDMPKDKLPSGYSKVSLAYNEDKIEAYQNIDKHVTYAATEDVEGNDFYLVYAVNEVTGKESVYMYDKKENTIQRFNGSLISKYEDKNDKYFLYMLISIIVTAISIITLSIVLLTKKKNKIRFA